jgi:hypothetical protein
MGSQIFESYCVWNDIDIYQNKPNDPQDKISIEGLVLFPFKPNPANPFFHEDKASREERIGNQGYQNTQSSCHGINLSSLNLKVHLPLASLFFILLEA